MNPGTKGNKPKYVSKAERAKLDAVAEQPDGSLEQTPETATQDQSS